MIKLHLDFACWAFDTYWSATLLALADIIENLT